MLSRLKPIHVNAVSPVGWPWRLTASPSVPDLTAVTDAVLVVRKPGETAVRWAMTFKTKTAAQSDLFYLFQAGDINKVGDYVGYVEVTVSGGGVARTGCAILPVLPEFE